MTTYICVYGPCVILQDMDAVEDPPVDMRSRYLPAYPRNVFANGLEGFVN